MMLALLAVLAGALVAAGPSPSPTTAPTQPLKQGDQIIFLGDSITQAGTRPKGFITLVKNAFPANARITITNAGVGGNTVTDLQARLQKDVLDKKPTVVVIYIGVNDVVSGGRGTPKDKFEEGLKDIIGRIQKVNARVILCTPSVRGERPGGKNQYDRELEEYSEVSRKVALEMKVQLRDIRKAFVDYEAANNKEDAAQGLLTVDGVHLSDAGNEFVARQMMSALAIPIPRSTTTTATGGK